MPVEVASGGAHAGDHPRDVVEAVEVLVGGDERSEVEPAELDVVTGDVVVDRHPHRPELAVGAVVEAMGADAALRARAGLEQPHGPAPLLELVGRHQPGDAATEHGDAAGDTALRGGVDARQVLRERGLAHGIASGRCSQRPCR